MKTKTFLLATGVILGWVSLFLGLCTIIAHPVEAQAANTIYHVAPGGDCGGAPDCYATIQAAVDAASPGDEIRVAGGTYSGVSARPRIDLQVTGMITQVVYINKSLSLVGGYTITNWTTPAPNLYPTIIDAQTLGRGIYAAGEGIAVRLENLAVLHGNATNQQGHLLYETYDAGGGVYFYKAQVEMIHCTVSDSNATASTTTLGAGGGVFGFLSPGVTISGTQVSNNTASTGGRQGNGGGLGFYDSIVTIQSSAVLTNTAGKTRSGWGGGLYMGLGSLQVQNSEFRGNLASRPVSTSYVGHGGAIYMDGGTAVVANAQVMNNQGSNSYPNATFAARGGGLYFHNTNLTLTSSRIQWNLATSRGKGNGGGVYVEAGQLVMVDTQVLNNTASTGDYAYGGGVSITNVDSVVMRGNTISDNICTTSKYCMGGGVYLQGSPAIVEANLILNNSGGNESTTASAGGGIYIHGPSFELDRNIILGNSSANAGNSDGGGVYISINNLAFTFTNNIVADNYATRNGSGVYVLYGNGSTLLHNTIANNTGGAAGVFSAGQYPPSTLYLKNNIIAGHPGLGVQADTGTFAVLDGTLWNENGTDTGGAGTVQTAHDHTGDPAFVDAAGGNYHIGAISAAINKAIASSLDHDLDDQARPNGPASDLGADEYYLPAPIAAADKIAFPPQWWVRYQPLTSNLKMEYIQRYLLTFSQENPALTGLHFQVTDTLPAGLAYDWAATSLPVNQAQLGNTLTWQTLQPLASGQVGQVMLGTRGTGIQPGEILTNHARVKGGTWDFTLEAPTTVPLFPPLITEPGTGEKCPEPLGLSVKGIAPPGQFVRLYVNEVFIAAAQVDSQGLFTATLDSFNQLRVTTTLHAVTCLTSAPATCSPPSPQVKLVPAQGMFCPQVSTWVDVPEIGPFAGQTVTYRFRDATGRFVTNGWVISAPLTFKNTILNLKVQPCPAPYITTAVWITIEGAGFQQSFSPTNTNHPWYTFNVNADLPVGYHEVQFFEACGLPGRVVEESIEISSTATLNLHQGGQVSDAVTQAPLAGVTVTLMVSNTAWGGWTPWLPETAETGQNPQVSKANGGFSFLAPPDLYYLAVEPPPGYQPYRSAVITQPLEMHISLAPQANVADVEIHLKPTGPNPAEVTIKPGQVVRWRVDIPPEAEVQERLYLADHPVVHLQGPNWDAGTLAPGDTFSFTFAAKGDHPFSDGLGHQGIIHVLEGFTIYLPLVRR